MTHAEFQAEMVRFRSHAVAQRGAIDALIASIDVTMPLFAEPAKATQPVLIDKARPQSPAPRQTKEAGRPNEDKVLAALSGGPLSPKVIQQKSGIPEKSLQHVLRRLLARNLVTKTGKTWKTSYRLT